MSDDTSVFALHYASRPEATAGEAYYRHDLYHEPDSTIGMDYFFWLIRAGGESVVVDCGFAEHLGPIRNRWIETPPTTLLQRMGVEPEEVQHVILSHMHFDHVGNIHLFPNATFYMGRAEFEYWTGPFRDNTAFSWTVEDREVRQVEALKEEGRLVLVDDSAEIGTTGVRVTCFPGHTPGSLVTEIDHPDGTVVLASDTMHYYDEGLLNRPFVAFTDMEKMLHSYDGLRELDARPGYDLVPGHDPAVLRRYEEVAKDCFDLTKKKENA
ncbi:N-acyl homoserine lactonase family protein [Microbacterium aoyamense]|uniref:N-acyl homoserine lactonase family protein n=1 Tax=Microbacterium aoyamense TaxID=344166 RepID=A0ABN2PCE4_9MICO|nr:N-acyl homoserine lactonase family protein [Microbacterium aoyamense]